MVAIFLAPVSPSFQKNKDGNLTVTPKINTASAATTFTVTSATIVPTAAHIYLTIQNYDSAYRNLVSAISTLDSTGQPQQIGDVNTDNLVTVGSDNTATARIDLTTPALTPNTKYTLYLQMAKITGLFFHDLTMSGYKVEFTTPSTDYSIPATLGGNTLNGPAGTNNAAESNQGTNFYSSTGGAFGCNDIVSTFTKCIVSAFYYLTWVPVNWIAKGAAAVLDFFIYYSISSTAYSSGFIGSAWATVRDIANLFFIIALLWVAIQTILGIGHHGKNMIATIVIVALVINFSLFVTQVIIDSSNILAKVFYNHIDAKGANGEIVGPTDQKSITVSLVSAFNPQQMIYDATDKIGVSFLTILLSTALMIFMIIIFLSVAFLFVGRVAGLWISMIFAPIAFASYTLPVDIPGIGHKEWWDKLLEQAFMAPIFIFFLYVILLLGKSFQLIVSDYTSTDSTLAAVMKVTIPFMLIFILLREAKKLAVKYSGEMGAAFTKVGGFAMGAVGGAAAFALTGGVGKLAGMAGKSAWVQENIEKKGMAGFGARMALRTADYGQKATFDIRKSPVGTALAGQGIDLKSGLGAIGLGEDVTTGGYKGVAKRKQEKIEKEKDLFKTKMSDDEVKAWSAKKAEEWEKKKAVEQTRLGTAFNEKVFEEMNGKKPAFNTAKQLDEHRMKTYRDNIGKTGLVYSIASSVTKGVTPEQLKTAKDEYAAKDEVYKKAHKEPTFESLTEIKVKTAKNIIGGAAIIATAGFGGINELTTIEGEAGARKAISKEIKKAGDIEKEMEELKIKKEKLEIDIEKLRITAKAESMSIEDYVNNELIKVEQEIDAVKGEETYHRNERLNLERILSSASKTPKYGGASEFDTISKQIKEFKDKEDKAKSDSVIAIKKKFKLESEKNYEKDLLSTNTRIDTLEGKTEKSHKSHEEKGKGIDDAAHVDTSHGKSTKKEDTHH